MDIVRSRQFGKLVRRHRLDRGLTQADIAGMVGPLPETGKWMNATQVSRIEAGMKEMDRWLIERLIEVLEMDPDEGWEAATGAPPGFTADGYRKVLADARARASDPTGDSHENLLRLPSRPRWTLPLTWPTTRPAAAPAGAPPRIPIRPVPIAA